MKIISLFIRSLAILSFAATASTPVSQDQQDQLAQKLTFQQGVVSNFLEQAGQHQGRIIISNQSDISLQSDHDWSVYFHNIRKISKSLNDNVVIKHVQGDLYQMTAGPNFKALAPKQSLTIDYIAAAWVVSQSDLMPRAFVVIGDNRPSIIANTDSENFEQFVLPFTYNEQLYRFNSPSDNYAQVTPQSRFKRNANAYSKRYSQEAIDRQIIPFPAKVERRRGQASITSQWRLIYDGALTNEAAQLQQQLTAYLGQPLQQLLSSQAHSKEKRVIRLQLDGKQSTAEGYVLEIDSDVIVIRGADEAGVFYGIQSLLALFPITTSEPLTVAKMTVIDKPLFPWRGMHYDLGRNFHGYQAIETLIKQMARYKLNKLHLHLSDDEGWRLQIPGLPELTEIGAYRCFDLTEQQCLLTQLGTGPFKSGSGNGFLTTEQFITLLTLAKQHHIEVIPELDMPGHSRAAIVAMNARSQRLLKAGASVEQANTYRLSDDKDLSQYYSVQNYTDNALNVCLESSYQFIDKVLYELQQMYRSADSQLNIYHFGGDETPKGAWQDSPVCQALFEAPNNGVSGVADLKAYFSKRVSQLSAARGLDLAGWEDGLMYSTTVPFARSQFANQRVIGNTWDNIWEWGVADRSYRLANDGYQVVLSSATHLYFDHPYETSPYERGYYWATRYSDTQKTFGYNPLDLYANADFTREGNPINDLEGLVGRRMPALQKPEHLLGMQGHVWTETIRTPEQLQQMVFPRILAVAQRAWHKGVWQNTAGAESAQEQSEQWSLFAQTLAQKELPRLVRDGVSPRLPLVGVERDTSSNKLKVNSAFPGLTIEFSNDGSNWTPLAKQALDPSSPWWFRTRVGKLSGASTHYQP
ncbi:family 20 glycosylhydrolase [Paraferrimonas haliotis]|uniref:beta-N-acetylhexosaminidase n=1 Tax=Paraferrimonas haliotis TaxID=2013866 RepID=A0AA37WXG5_9GAMM|nr:family 20 glycosylhydrolase [Paraferrimonas haliotis]GLS82415.1 beta-N-acetylhexosaminidase [Paraferrimonas haliotis]